MSLIQHTGWTYRLTHGHTDTHRQLCMNSPRCAALRIDWLAQFETSCHTLSARTNSLWFAVVRQKRLYIAKSSSSGCQKLGAKGGPSSPSHLSSFPPILPPSKHTNPLSSCCGLNMSLKLRKRGGRKGRAPRLHGFQCGRS